jgi:hypothetical protein
MNNNNNKDLEEGGSGSSQHALVDCDTMKKHQDKR